jgi:chitinase
MYTKDIKTLKRKNAIMKKMMRYIVLMILLLIVSSCIENQSSQTEETIINQIEIEYDADNHEVSTSNLNAIVSIEIKPDRIEISIHAKDGYIFSNEVQFYMNGNLLESGQYIFTPHHIIFIIFEETSGFNYKDVLVTLDPNGGYFSSLEFLFIESDYELNLTALNDETGNQLTLISQNQTGYRWFYKLFIKYNHQMMAYEVVNVDYRTSTIELKNVDDYDFILGVSDQTEDIAAKIIIMNYAQTENLQLFISFDQDLNHYQTGVLTASFYEGESLMNPIEKTYHLPDLLPTPVKFEHHFIGWSDGTEIYPSYLGYLQTDTIESLSLFAVWEGYSQEEVISYVHSKIPNIANQDLNLPRSYSDYDISWISSHENIISNHGTFNRPYIKTTVQLQATFTSTHQTFSYTYQIETTGYKALSTGIASSYIYRNYHLVDDAFFETLDIINCAFMIANIDGSITGNSFLSNVSAYIMPKAKEHGNWVILSIAPESAWSVIAASPQLVNQFAINIVNIINTYGFDGVDIDWETPTSQEKERYTELMRVVYQTVKANNPHHLVTTAITGGMWQPPRYDLNNSLKYIDYINMMTYGMVSNQGYYQNALHPSSNFHDPANLAGRTLTTCSISESIQIFHGQYQVPLSKIIVGVAFYGIRQQRTFNTSTNTFSSWSNLGSIHYTSINQLLSNSLYTERFDENAGVPYLIKNDGTEFISYDNPRSIRLKSQYVLTHGLGGMMFWEYGTDTTGLLLNAMKEGLNK